MNSKRIMQVGSLSFRVVIYFAMNHDEELNTRDIAEKFDAKLDDVPGLLRRAVETGWLGRQRGERRGQLGKPPDIYGPGPNILAMLEGATK